MTEPSDLLALLQHGDSFFPGGAFASSRGLETLHRESKVCDAESLSRLIEGRLRFRWAACDRPALIAAYRAGDMIERVKEVDVELEALSLARELREASRRAGRALLRVHAQLGTSKAAIYLDLIKTGQAWGHIPVVQGLVWKGIDLAEGDAVTLSGHLLCVTFVSAAVRLGFISHIEAQQVLRKTQTILVALIQSPIPPYLSSYTPAADIAMMRHEVQPVRLFAN